jgi:preprotein translocase subunit SecE
VARNRKRRSDRRPRRPSDGAGAPPGVATARAGRHDETPEALEHATPDVELAEAQLALGRPELSEAPDDSDPVSDEDLAAAAGGPGGGGDDDSGFDDGSGDDGSGDGGTAGGVVPGAASTPARRGLPRLVQFLRASWRELQRVQWPDRRQVMQATGVVIGFVIVAGVFLGVADFVAGRVVNLILK